MSKALRRTLPIAVAMTTLILLSQTALGYVETKTKGTVGPHSLTDTMGSPGAICDYKPSATPNVAQLKHIYVNAPHIKAITGAGTEKVGWRFVIQRVKTGPGQSGVFKPLYKSPIWSASTDSTHNAAFSQQGAKVTIPYDYETAPYFSGYRVIVKLYWYKANGTTVRGSATERLEFYTIDHGANPGPFNEACSDFDD